MPSSKRTASSRARSAVPTSRQIERHYVQEIQSGRIAPGSKLPSNQEMAKKWFTSCSTVQKALLSLVAMGLVDRTKKRGTFVRERSERALVGILFGPNLNVSSASFYRVLSSAISRELSTDYLACRIYDNLATQDRAERNALTHDLKIDQTYHTFRGFVHIVSLPRGIDMDSVVPPSVPKVVFDDERKDNDFLFDRKGLMDETARALRERGCQRIRFVISEGTNFKKHRQFFDQALRKAAAKYDIPSLDLLPVPVTPTEDVIEADTDAFLSHYIATTPPNALADGLIFLDDIATRGGIYALLKKGIRVPEQIAIASLASEGVDIHYPVPVTRYEFPIRTLSREIAGLLRARMAERAEETPRPLVISGRLIEPAC